MQRSRDLLVQGAPVPVESVTSFQDYSLEVSTLPVRGLACAAAERAQYAAYTSPAPMESGAFFGSIKLSECAHAGNDCPKKFGNQHHQLGQKVVGGRGFKADVNKEFHGPEAQVPTQGPGIWAGPEKFELCFDTPETVEPRHRLGARP